MTTRRVRVVDLETSGDAVTDVCEIGWQDVVSIDGGRWEVNDERGSLFVNPGRPITPETMSVHHILDEQVRDAPLWSDVAPKVLKPDGGLVALAAHRASFEQHHCTPRFAGGAPWICTWKGSLRVWPELSGFSNQMLRYQRRPVGLVHELGLPAHRAMPDAYVTAFTLRDMLNEVDIKALIAWSKQPGLLPRVRSGLERGRAWDTISDEALAELARDRDLDTRFTAQTEQRRRGARELSLEAPPVQASLF